LTSVIEKRLSLHRKLANQEQVNQALKSKVIKLQSLSDLGKATFMIAHEINNLLTPLSNYAQLALKNPDDKELAKKALDKTILNCERCRSILESMLSLANGDSQKKQTVQLLVLVEQVFECLCRDFSKDRIDVTISIPKQLKLNVVPIQIQQLFMNLILNARSAMLPKGGILKIEAKQQDDLVIIRVIDNGRGIEPGQLNRIFEPFISIRKKENTARWPGGAGLGLAFCKEIAETHKGTISVESVPDKGTTFTITLPKI
jgi:signal transduction histidine kinase